MRWEEKLRKRRRKGGNHKLHGGAFPLPHLFALKFMAGGNSFITVKTDTEFC